VGLTTVPGTLQHQAPQPSYGPRDTNCDGDLANHPVTKRQTGKSEVINLR
jgi:hypothetical protein